MFNGILTRSKLKHNPKLISEIFSNKGDSVIAKDNFYIIFPERYIAKNLAVMGSTVSLLSVYAVVDRNMNYGVVMAPIMMEVIPNNVTNVLVDGVVNKVLEVNKGETFIINRNLLRTAPFMYDVLDEFFLQGNVPWYLNYQLLAELFTESAKYAGSNIGNDPLAMEVITSIISRTKDDKFTSFREVVKSSDTKLVPYYIGMSNVNYSYDNTLSKLMGGYFKQGITTAIVNRESETTKVSALLRA